MTARVVFFILIAFASSAFAQESAVDTGRSVVGSLKSGVEYDDNVRRESNRSTQGFLTRYFGTIGVVTSPFKRSIVAFDVNHGGKFFFVDDQSDSDTLITQIGTTFQHRFADRFAYDAFIDMKDRTERAPVRDYNRGGGGAGFSLLFDRVDARLGGAWRYFAFKPNPGSSSSNVEGTARLGFRPIDPLKLSLGYTVAPRFFQTDRTDNLDGNIEFIDGELRRDLFHTGQVGIGYRGGPFVGQFDYTFSLNRSNSFGQDLVRHAGALSVTFALPLSFYLSARLDLQRTSYDDPVQIDASFLVDEDNRNAVVSSLVKAFGNFEIEAKYSLYLQEFGVGADYRRQTILFAVAYNYE